MMVMMMMMMTVYLSVSAVLCEEASKEQQIHIEDTGRGGWNKGTKQ